MNSELINALIDLKDMAGLTGDVFREKAYLRAVNIIRRTGYQITIQNIDGLRLTATMADKVREYLRTGKIAELERIKRSRKYRAYRELSGIIGVGPETIKKYISLRIYNLDDLRRAVARGRVTLNNMQKYGLMYYDDLNTPIPRDEVTHIGSVIWGAIRGLDPDMKFDIAGSYRRGNARSGDVDIIVSSNRDILPRIVDTLRNDSRFIDTLNNGSERITFLYRGSRVRQVDIINLPGDRYWSGLLYFTGSYDFNEAMRGYAKKRGYRLNQNGIFKGGRALPIKSERDIFEILHLKYIPPSERTGGDKIESR